MKNINICDGNFTIRVGNDFLMENTTMKPSSYIMYLNIFRLIQIRETTNYKNELYITKGFYDFTRNEISGVLNDQFYQKTQLDKILNDMIDNQIEDIIQDFEYDGNTLSIYFDQDVFCNYFMSKSNYTILDIKDFVGIKNINCIKFMMLINRFSSKGWVKIKEEDIRLLLNKIENDSVETKTLTRDIKSIINKLQDKYMIKEFKSCKSKNIMQYEFKFDSFKYIY